LPATTRAVNQFELFLASQVRSRRRRILVPSARRPTIASASRALSATSSSRYIQHAAQRPAGGLHEPRLSEPTSPSPSLVGGPSADEENSFNITIGISWYPGRNARSRTVRRPNLDALHAGRQQRHVPRRPGSHVLVYLAINAQRKPGEHFIPRET